MGSFFSFCIYSTFLMRVLKLNSYYVKYLSLYNDDKNCLWKLGRYYCFKNFNQQNQLKNFATNITYQLLCFNFLKKTFPTSLNSRIAVHKRFLDSTKNVYCSRYTKPQTFADCIGNELPLGWEEAYDPQIGRYYINHVNRE